MKYWLKNISEKTVVRRMAKVDGRRNRGKYINNPLGETYAKNSIYRADLTRKATKAEIILGDWLWENKISFKFQKGFVTPFHRIVDFYLRVHNLIIEVDGGYHKAIKVKDNEKDVRWKNERGISTIRLTNEQVFDGEHKLILDYLIPNWARVQIKEKPKTETTIKLPTNYLEMLMGR